MYTLNQVVWQPVNFSTEHHAFDILLDSAFANRMLEARIGYEIQNRMNGLGNQICEAFGRSGHTYPYIFWEDTALVRKINYRAGQGVWLGLDTPGGNLPDPSSKKPWRYTNNNMDHSSDTLALIKLFAEWINYSDSMIKVANENKTT